MAAFITKYIVSAANASIRKGPGRRANAKLLWNEECEKAKKDQNET